MGSEERKRSPEDFLRECEAEEAAATKGRLKVFLGYASGVGKSFRMFDEVRRRRLRGQDVVVGAVQPAVPPDVEALLRNLEVIPLAAGSALDVAAILRRRPASCVVDGLAYDNPPGSAHPHRWQDVQQLLDAGINVIATINIQYLEELADQVAAITGKRAKETVPVSFLMKAGDIEIVDASAEQAPAEWSRLRELAFVVTADIVEHQLTDYLERQGIRAQFRTHERIMVCVTPRANIQPMLDTALTIADRFHAELIVAYVNQPNLSDADREALNERLTAARAAGAQVEILEGDDPARVLLTFARDRGVTQIFVGHTQQSSLSARLWGGPIDRLIRAAATMDVRVFPQ